MTPSLWPAPDGDDGAESAATAGPGRQPGRERDGWVRDARRVPGAGRGSLRGGGGGAVTGMLADIPPTPELLAKVAALPPANDEPEVSRSWARAPDPHFTLRRLLKPFAIALTAGLILDGLDALASIAMPLLVRNGIDNGVLAKTFHAIVVIALVALAIVVADWVVNVFQTVVVGRNGERLLYSLRVKIFSQLQRLGLDYYERELTGRIMTRMTTDVDALSSFLQTGLITWSTRAVVLRGADRAADHQPEARLHAAGDRPAADRGHRLVPAQGVAGVPRGPGAGQRGQRRPAGERGRAAGGPGLPARAGEPRPVRRAERRVHDLRLRAQRYIALYFPFVQALSTIAGAAALFVAAGEVHSRALTADR